VSERNKTIEITPEALKIANTPQLYAIVRLISPDTVGKILVATGEGFALPEGYLSFRYDYTEAASREGMQNSIYGGIDTDGSVST